MSFLARTKPESIVVFKGSPAQRLLERKCIAHRTTDIRSIHDAIEEWDPSHYLFSSGNDDTAHTAIQCGVEIECVGRPTFSYELGQRIGFVIIGMLGSLPFADDWLSFFAFSMCIAILLETVVSRKPIWTK